MKTTKLSSNGRISLPRSVRRARNLQPGTEFVVEDTPEGILLRPVKPFSRTEVDAVFGSLRCSRGAKTVEEMHDAVLAEAKPRR